MSLRARMGLAGGVAVALAVIAVAVAAYAGTRSELRGQVDNSLQQPGRADRDRAGPTEGSQRQAAASRPGAPGFGGRAPAGGGGPPVASPPIAGDCDRGLGLDRSAGPGSAAPRACVSSSPAADGAVRSAASSARRRSTRAPRRSQPAASGQYFADTNVSGHHLRVLVVGLAGRGALQVALPLADVDKALRNQLLLLIVIGRRRDRLAALLGMLVARTALAPIARFTRQTESIAANPERLEQ